MMPVVLESLGFLVNVDAGSERESEGIGNQYQELKLYTKNDSTVLTRSAAVQWQILHEK